MKHHVASRLLICFALVAGLIGAVSSASAQNSIPVTIPFGFVANHQFMPAGEYKVRFLTPQLMSLADGQTGITKTLLLVRPKSEQTMETRGRLIFLRADTRYYLTQVRIPGSSVHSELVVQPSLERELSTQSPSAESRVEIAFK